MQKSLAGLYRGLLHDVLASCPDLISQVLPGIWARVAATPWQAQANLQITEREIREAFEQLVGNNSVAETHCFCFFIDGLDKFDETTQCNHPLMVELLRNWTVACPGSLKLCVSSREYNIFMKTFAGSPRIRLHELTRSDMPAYSEDKLSHILNAKHQKEFAEGIMHKAQGIFLWVAIVSKSLRRQAEDGASISDLRRELESLPDGRT